MASYSYERDITPEDLIQETPPPLTPAQQRANWWHYHWYYVVLIAAALLAVGYFVWNRVTEVRPDYTVAVVSRTDPDTAFLSQLETQLEALAGDVNGDGKVKVTVKGIWLALDFETQDAALQQLMQSSEDKLNSDFYLCESTLFIVDDPTAMEQRYGCFQTLDGTGGRRCSVGGRLCSAAARHRPCQCAARKLYPLVRRPPPERGNECGCRCRFECAVGEAGLRIARAYSLHRHGAVQGFGCSQQAFCNANGVCIDRHIACRCRRCIYVCPACNNYEASQCASQI